MGVIRTDKWLESYKEKWEEASGNGKITVQRTEIIDRLQSHFSDVNTTELHEYLLGNGLFLPKQDVTSTVNSFLKGHVFKEVNRFYESLRRDWRGPNVPIFILPVNLQNRSIRTEFKGKTGLAFHDKIFLFITEDLPPEELHALLTHEYHHVCRLKGMNKQDESITLLDSLVMEGLAEKAVEERVGTQYLAPWTSVYNEERSYRLYHRFLQKNIHKTKEEMDPFPFLYGSNLYPKWIGYNAGWHIVNQYMKKSKGKTTAFFKKSSKTILEGSQFGV
jgi:uncharacterized protein YjaZ